jgi:O-antigen ligase
MSLFLLIVVSYSTDLLDGLINVGFMYLSPFRLCYFALVFFLLLWFCKDRLSFPAVSGRVSQAWIPCILFVIAASVSMLANGDIRAGAKRIMFLLIQFSSAPIVAYYLDRRYGRTGKKHFLGIFEFSTIGIAIILVAVGLIQEVTNNVWWGDSDYRSSVIIHGLRVPSLFYDPNFFGYALIIPFFVNLRITYTGNKKADRLLRFIVGCLLLVGVNITGSHGTTLSIIAGLLFLYAEKHGQVRHLVEIVVIAFFTLAVFVILNLKQVIGFITTSSFFNTMLPRLLSWYSGIMSALHSPLLGIGPGRFTSIDKMSLISTLYAFPNPDALNRLAAHSIYVEIFVECGFLGLILFLVFLLRMLDGGKPSVWADPRLGIYRAAFIATACANLTLSYYPSFLFISYGVFLSAFKGAGPVESNKRTVAPRIVPQPRSL